MVTAKSINDRGPKPTEGTATEIRGNDCPAFFTGFMATFSEQTGRSIDAAFAAFHADNPHVYERFKALAFKMIRAGKKHYSSKTLICAMRFEQDLETVSDDGFKINDAFTPCYARRFAEDFPEYKDFFEFRKSKTDALPRVQGVLEFEETCDV